VEVSSSTGADVDDSPSRERLGEGVISSLSLAGESQSEGERNRICITDLPGEHALLTNDRLRYRIASAQPIKRRSC